MLNTKHLISNNISYLLSNLSTYAAYTAHPSESSRLKHLFPAGQCAGEGGAQYCRRARGATVARAGLVAVDIKAQGGVRGAMVVRFVVLFVHFSWDGRFSRAH